MTEELEQQGNEFSALLATNPRSTPSSCVIQPEIRNSHVAHPHSDSGDCSGLSSAFCGFEYARTANGTTDVAEHLPANIAAL